MLFFYGQSLVFCFSKAIPFSKVKNNKLESSGNSITEGIGTARITKNFDKALVDEAFQTDYVEALNLVYDLIEKQRIVLGGSSGINIAGAIKLAKKNVKFFCEIISPFQN